MGYAAYHSFSIFYVAILDDFGWSRATTAAAYSLFSLIYGFTSPLAGWLVDRFGPRLVVPMAAVILGIGLVLTAQMSEIGKAGRLHRGRGLRGRGASVWPSGPCSAGGPST